MQVAVHVRPLIGSEQEAGCQESLAVTPGVPQVSQPHEHVHVNMHQLTWLNVHTSWRSLHSTLMDRIKMVKNAAVGCHWSTHLQL